MERDAGGAGPVRSGKEGFFFEKKKQKTFLNWACGVEASTAQFKPKFLRRFF
jgi:hypothetical protein